MGGPDAGRSEAGRRIGRPAGADAARTRRVLLDAAASELTAVGYEQMNLERVAAAAGITRGAVYRYFGSKRELARAAVLELHVGHEHLVERLVDTAPGLKEQLRALVRVSVDVALREDRPYVGYFEMARLAENDPAVASKFRDQHAHIRATVRRLLDSAAERGELAVGADREEIADGVLGLLWALGVGASGAPNDAVRRQLLLATELVLNDPPWLTSGPGPRAS